MPVCRECSGCSLLCKVIFIIPLTRYPYYRKKYHFYINAYFCVIFTDAFALQIYAAAGMSVSKISGQKFFLIWKIES